MTLKRTMCALLAATMLVPSAVMAETAASAAEVDVSGSEASVSEESSGASYGLASSCQDGTILHCFDWKYNDIAAELQGIAEAGFTSVQTSPAQPDGSGAWYWLYQPKSFSVGTNGLGTKQDLQNLCNSAKNYGIKVIVDVVANHLNGDHSSIQSDLRDSQYWHSYGQVHSWEDRYQVTHGEIGMADLATENSYVQQCVKNYILELKDMGVSGIRWDAVKHIGLPSEDDNFLPVVTGTGLYNYGEILVGPDDRKSGNEGLMKEYTNYMSVTDNVYGNDHRNAFAGGGVKAEYGNWVAKGLTSDKVVYWGESHDTWANAYEGGYSWNQSQNAVDRAYAAVATRNKASALYFSRPFSDPTAKENTTVGSKGSTHYTAKEVAAVNHFHNAMVGKADYYTASNGCAVITRQGGGAVIVKGSGSGQVSVENAGKYAKPGTYTDEVSGNTFTVTENTISGTIGDSGIAVIYDGKPASGISATPGSGSFTDSMTVTLSANNVTNAQYSTSDGQSGSFTDGKTLTFGSSVAAGSSVTLTLTAKDADGGSLTETYTYTKKDPNAVVKVYFDNASYNWSSVYAYVYDKSGSTVKELAAWPGKSMTKGSTGYYEVEIPDDLTANGQVIFAESKDSSNRYPGHDEAGLKINGSSKLFSAGNSWKDYTPASKLSVSLAASPTTVNVGDSVNLTATASGGSGTVTYTFSTGSTTIPSSGNKATWTPSAKGSYTITVTAKDSSSTATATANVTVNQVDDNTPTVTVDKASGSSFNTETTNIKLTLANATTGTYSVDNGPTKTFTGSKTVEIGEGKIGDSTITVKATATNAAGTTKNYEFTYQKKYVQKTSSSSSATLTEVASGALASQYKTNPSNGFGKSKTITIDGSISDWSSDMLIAQGAANDDPRVYCENSMHELPVDLYALYGAYDDNNVYLMWEMTNVQDVVASHIDYPISQGILWQTQELPFFIAVDTGKSDDAIGNKGNLQTGGTIWASGLSISKSFNRLISINTKGGNGPFVYAGDSTGLNAVEIYDSKTSGITMGFGKGILSTSVTGINGAFGANGGRVVGDVSNDSAAWVDFNTKGHNSSSMDFFYEMSIPYSELGITKSDVTNNGIGVMVISTFGMSGMDCVPYDATMNDNADQPDTQSQPINSFEKSDADNITVSFARIGKSGGDDPTPPDPTVPLQVNFGADRSAPQLSSTALTLKGIGYGGTAPYSYKISVDGTVVKASNSTDNCSWTPGTAGQHTIECVITDSKGATAKSTKTFTAEGSDPDTLTNNSSLSANSVEKNNTVTVNASATGGTAPYKYTYEVRRESVSTWTTKASDTSSTSITITPSYAEKYYIKVTVKDKNSKTASKTLTLNVTGGDDPVELKNTSTLSKYTVDKGTTVTVKGSATGGTAPYKFCYYVKKQSDSSYTMKGDGYSTTTSITLTPNYVTTYNVKVNVMDSTGKIVSKQMNLQVNGNDPLTNNSSLSKTSVQKGTSVTVKGAALGGTAPYKYCYYVKKSSDSSWTMKGDGYSTTTSITLTPNYVTVYNVKVNVMDSKGTIVSKELKLTVTDSLTNNSSLSATTVTAGSSVTVKGAASGGTSPYKYTYKVKAASASSWTTKATNTTATSVTLNPTKLEKYSVQVIVTDSKGATATKTLTFTVTAPALTNKSTVSATTVTAGSSVTVKGAATGGTSPYKYTYKVKAASASSWTTKATNTTATSVTLNPTKLEKYSVQVIVTDAAGKTASKTLTFTVTAAALTNKSTVSATSVTSGSSVTVKGAATGGTSPYKYTYKVKAESSSSWTTKASNTTSTSITLNPTKLEKYSVQVIVTDAAGKTASKTLTFTVSAASLTNKSSLSATSVTAGTTVTVKGAASGGTAPYVYTYQVKAASATSWTTKADYTSSTSVTIKPSKSETYYVRVTVTDSKNATSTKTMTLTVK